MNEYCLKSIKVSLLESDGAHSFSYEELIEEMERNPARFSNNVVTRPLMQEYVFPTLAFIGGPGN